MRYFHREVYMPKTVRFSSATFSLRYSRHAAEEAQGDRLGDLTMLLPTTYRIDPAQVVEAGMPDGHAIVTHLLVRIPAAPGVDLCLALAPNEEGLTVKTVWANRSNDSHRTLDTTRYEKGPKGRKESN